jgi:hypothetical protein
VEFIEFMEFIEFIETGDWRLGAVRWLMVKWLDRGERLGARVWRLEIGD